jgi:glycosyltransferase involved in cell wall biosynthesis
MRLAVINHVGDMAAGAEHALVEYVRRLPAEVTPLFFLFEDGQFAQMLRDQFGEVTIVPMSHRISQVERNKLSFAAVPDAFGHAMRLTNALRAVAPDVVLTNSMKAHIIGSLSARLLGLPCINYVHDFVTGGARTLLALVSGLCARERITCSKAVAASLGLPRTTAVYSAVDTSAYRELPDRNTAKSALGLPVDDLPVVGLVGRIARWKGQDRFIRIAADVLQTVDAHFVIVGSPIFGCDPAYVPELTATIAALKVSDRIHFVPWQSDMRSVYATVDVAANCSEREPFGRTMLEALASGVPIVCFDDAGVAEILAGRRCGTVVPAGNECAFADGVRLYLTDADLRADAQATARSVAEPFDVTVAWQPFAEVIARVSEQRSPSTRRPALNGAATEARVP